MKRRRCTPIADQAHRNVVPGVAAGNDLLALLRPYARHCGDSRRKAWRMGSRRLLDYLLVYIAEGRGRFTIGAREYAAEPGDLFWIPPDTLHSMEGYPPAMHCPYVHFDLLYRPDHSHWDFTIPAGITDLGELRPLLHARLDHPLLTPLAGRIRGHTNRRVGQLIQEICAEAARAQPFAGVRMSGLLTEIVAEILRGREDLPPEHIAHIPLLERAADQMAGAGHETRTVGAWACQCKLSPSHFRLLFQRHFGCSPRTYQRRARLRRARELMINTPMTLSEIAVQVGFSTVHSLSRAFRAMEGISPGEYRRCAVVNTRVEGRKTPYSF